MEAKPVPAAPQPAATAPLRLIQIRALARNFSATEQVKGKWDQLRMLSQPIYRYKSESTNAPDGAVFAFLWDYDPEAFLIIEERDTVAGRRWHYALAQFGTWSLSVSYQDTEVWSRGRNRSITELQNPHFMFTATHSDYLLSHPSDRGDRGPN